MRREIYLDKRLEGGSKSAVLFHEDNLVHVSLGVGGPNNSERYPLVWMWLQFAEVELFGGPEHYKEIKETPKEKRTALVLKWALGAMTPKLLQELLKAQFEQGKRVGRNELRAEFKQLLSTE